MTIPKKIGCFCGKSCPASDMLRIPNTGVVKGVVSMVCRNCPNKAKEEVMKLFAIVCAGCREVVCYGEPGKEPSGFEWKAGQCYHVPNCPSCKGVIFESSPVIEQKLFYRERGLPYKDDHGI